MRTGHSAFSFKNEGKLVRREPSDETPSFLKEKAECPHWSFAAFVSRLTELSASPAGAPLTLAFRLVLDAQRRGEPVAWIGRKDAPFYPPDAADTGVDLAALPVVWTADAVTAAKAADLLVRSGAFGLVVLDLAARRAFPCTRPRAWRCWPGSTTRRSSA